MATQSRGTKRDGAHGVVYICGDRTRGSVTPYEPLQGRRVRGIFGGRGQFVAIVDAYELEWQASRARSQVLEQETVALGLKRDIKLQQVAFGEHHRVAVTLDGHLYSWGSRDVTLATGELGHVAEAWHPVTLTPRSEAANAAAATTPQPPKPHNEPEVEEIEFEDREDENGVHTGASICLPRRVHTPQHLFFTKVACGSHHSVALTDKGDLYAWGRNFEGQLGLASASRPVSVDRLFNGMSAWPKYVSALLGQPRVTDVACADRFTVALLADGSVWRWGERVAGVTRHEAMDAKPRRVKISSPVDEAPVFIGIATGTSHALAVTRDGTIYATGLNAYGQLGLGVDHKESSDALCRVTTDNVTVSFTTVVAGSHYSAAIATDGQLWTWGNGRYGHLGHGPPASHEWTPRAIDALRGVNVASVVCGQYHLYAFAPTVVTSISPTAGDVGGGYELRIRGSGFWDSENLTVRFVPLTEGRLPRGALARFDATTHEVVCDVPTFSLAGEFAVEVATNGKHFTNDGHVFEAFKRPTIASVSRWEARLSGGEELVVTIEGALPRVCTIPLLGLEISGDRLQIAGTVESSSALSPRDDESFMTSVLRFVTPSVSDATSVVRCDLGLSLNGGHQFMPIELAKTPCVLELHDAAVTRCRPNSFMARSLPTTVSLAVRHLLAPSETVDWSHVSAALRVAPLNVSDVTVESRVDVTLRIDTVQRSAKDASAVVTCTIPPLNEWNLSKLDHATGERVVIATDWWKFVPRWGFEANFLVSMNRGLSLLPTTSGPVFGLFASPKMLTATPLATPSSGGTIVSVAADAFHFDTDDAVVLLRWKDHREVSVPAKVRADSTESSVTTRRLTFTTATLPFPLPPTPPAPPVTEENEASTTPVEEPAPVDDTVGPVEEVDVLVSLDGRNFQREATVRLTYFRLPELLEVAPNEAQPGAHMTLKIDKVPPPSPALASACVRLTTAALGLSTIVPVDVNEGANALEFILPTLPITDEDSVRIEFALDGQQFSSGHITADAASDTVRDVSFRYRAPPLVVDNTCEEQSS